MTLDVLKQLSSSTPSHADIQDQRRRMNQQPAINDAQVTAEAAVALPPVGAMMEWAGATEPTDGKWLFCDGRIVQRNAYPLLFETIGTTWNTGGELATEFRIPDRRGRTGIGAGQGTGLTSRGLAARLGTEEHTLDVLQMPVHDHGSNTTAVQMTHDHAIGAYNNTHNHEYQYSAHSTIDGMDGGAPGGYQVVYRVNYYSGGTSIIDLSHNHDAGALTQTHNHPIAASGSGYAHPNMQPSVAVNYILRALP